MEAYFHNDSQVREWVDQITEKIFTVCLLTGVDSDAEFQSGCQIVMKIVSLLLEIPTIPSEFLADGVKQLLEQQLPDKRVIDSFPAYKATMDRMVNESILMVINSQNIETLTTLPSSVEDTVEDTVELAREFHDNDQEMYVAESHEEALIESALAALATIGIPHPDSQAGEDVVVTTETKIEVVIEKDNSFEPPMPISDTEKTEPKVVVDEVNQEPLRRVLSNIFPNSTVYWNKSLMGQTFLAQVEDVLILLHDQRCPFNLKNFSKAGWKVLVCSTEDLTFPRRLERGIRQIQRSGMKLLTV